MKNITLDKLITVDELSLGFLEPLNQSVKALIKIGNRSYTVAMQINSINDLDLMRAHLERVLLEYKLLGTLEFCSIFDRSITICLKKIPLNDEDFVTRVTATRIGDDEPMVSFYCRLPQVVSSIYISLLELVQIPPHCYADNDEWDCKSERYWVKYAPVLYSRLKSTVIEDYILTKNDVLFPKHYVTNNDAMIADYAVVYKMIYPNATPLQKSMFITTRNFLKASQRFDYEYTNDFSLLLPLLSHVKLKDGYRLKHYFKSEEGTFYFPDSSSHNHGKSQSYLCVENIISREIVYENLYEYFDFEFNEQSVWEFYLLLVYTVNSLPNGYSHYKIILNNRELLRLQPPACYYPEWKNDVLNLYSDNTLYFPSVKILNRNTAKLSVIMYTDYGGLQQHHIIVQRVNGNLKFGKPRKMTLRYYDWRY